MGKRLIAVLVTIVLLTTNIVTAKAADVPQNVVATDHQLYGYAEMVEDIILLAYKYPDIISISTMGNSAYGRNIPVVIIGNTNAPKENPGAVHDTCQGIHVQPAYNGDDRVCLRQLLCEHRKWYYICGAFFKCLFSYYSDGKS